MSYSTPGLLTDESRWLAKLARMQRMAIHAINGGGYNTPAQYSLLSADTLTLAADTYRNINFSVILGSVSVSMDGGDTSVIYPVGSNINMSASTTLDQSFVFIVSGTVSDGLNKVIIQTISA